MSIYPAATFRDVGAPDNFSNGPMHSHKGVVLHVNDSDGPSLYNWIIGEHDMSCHFQFASDGRVEQYIDTQYSSWCQSAGNDDYLSFETQGFPADPLTSAQFESVARCLAWCHTTHGIPLQLAQTVGDAGFAWHGMGGASWGGHPGCPGAARRSQMPALLLRAKEIIGDPDRKEADMFIVQRDESDGQHAVAILVGAGPFPQSLKGNVGAQRRSLLIADGVTVHVKSPDDYQIYRNWADQGETQNG